MIEKGNQTMWIKSAIDRFSPAVALVMLLIMLMIGTQIITRTDPAMSQPIREALASIPQRLNWGESTWVQSGDVPVPSGQERLLDLNAHFSKEYLRLGSFPAITGILFVAYCADARSMSGHHPPNCYPSSGWILDSSRTRTFEITRLDGRMVKACAYQFSRQRGGTQDLTVVNGFFATEEFFASTLEGAREVVRPNLLGGMGLFQFQILFQGVYSEADIKKYAREIIGGIPKNVFDETVGRAGDKSNGLVTGDDS